MSLNNLQKKIEIFNLAVSDKVGHVKLIRKRENYGASFINNKKGRYKTRSITLDKFKNKINKNCLIWIDVQGYEEKVLNGAKNLINNKIPFVIEFYPHLIKKFSKKSEIIKGLKKFKFFYDLKKDKLEKKKINEINLNYLFKIYNKKKATELLLINY